MGLTPGKKYNFEVKRQTDIAYMLESESDKDTLYFLHLNECQGKKLEIGQLVDAYLFLDNKNRLALTLYNPIIQNQEKAFLKVNGIVPNLGVFLNNNIQKDILLSKDILPENQNKWPKEGDFLYVEQTYNKRLLLKIAMPNHFDEIRKYNVDDIVVGYINQITQNGYTLLTKELDVIHIPIQHVKFDVRLGQELEVIITDYISKQNKNYYLARPKISFLEQTSKDADIILDYLNKHFGVLDLDSQSSSEKIKQVFPNFSRKQFKKALGYLYKKRLIEFKNDKTIIIK